jgi:hypothetical protein
MTTTVVNAPKMCVCTDCKALRRVANNMLERMNTIELYEAVGRLINEYPHRREEAIAHVVKLATPLVAEKKTQG